MFKDYAVIKINSKQYTVNQGAQLKVDRISNDSKIEVLLLKEGDNTMIGAPVLDDVGVKAEVISNDKDKKISVRRFKSKSRYRKNKGHRQPITKVRIIEFGTNTKPELIWIDSSIETANLESKTKEDKSTKNDKVETKLDTEIPDSTKKIKDLDISDSIRNKLLEAGYKNSEEIKAAGKSEILKLKGVGDKAVEKLFSQL